MELSNVLAQRGNPPQRLEATARVSFDRVGGNWRVVSSAIKVSGVVPGIDADGFREAAEDAKDNCPISQALKGNVALSVDASLQS
jgi:osmotically inducible protein OsmC